MVFRAFSAIKKTRLYFRLRAQLIRFLKGQFLVKTLQGHLWHFTPEAIQICLTQPSNGDHGAKKCPRSCFLRFPAIIEHKTLGSPSLPPPLNFLFYIFFAGRPEVIPEVPFFTSVLILVTQLIIFNHFLTHIWSRFMSTTTPQKHIKSIIFKDL